MGVVLLQTCEGCVTSLWSTLYSYVCADLLEVKCEWVDEV